MAKLTAWLVTILGAWMVLGFFVPALATDTLLSKWTTAIVVLVIGVSKLIRNYSKKRR